MTKDWQAWIKNHKHPETAQFVFDWMLRHDCDEAVWQIADGLVELVQARKRDLDRIYTHSDPDGEQQVSAFYRAFQGNKT